MVAYEKLRTEEETDPDQANDDDGDGQATALTPAELRKVWARCFIDLYVLIMYAQFCFAYS